MKRIVFLVLITSLTLATSGYAAEGIVTVKSAHNVPATADRLVTTLNAKGMNVFSRIDHAAGAAKVGKSLRPTELIIFGNPKVGTPLMLCSQSTGIDLPQKALIYEDESGQTWFSYNDPTYLAKRHSLEECTTVLQKIGTALSNFAVAATSP